ncbi:hypothetical protein C0Q70_05413 [Pomacea canaliculata]|uniref:Ionotropic glutamate receptor C-terminal domain-containing protein n=1 Tax=Pomacea canaliculata TaxID=400727 RepID=A0A2T7PL64_POMCA|nr:hypothetical protein C0Q70_05413 [Pomacea canaliculata]
MDKFFRSREVVSLELLSAFPREEILNYATLKMKEDGTLHRLENKWWYEKGECGRDTGHKESKKRSLSLSNVAGVFYILVSGLVIAIVLGLIEVYIYKRQKSKEAGLAHADTRTTVAETPQENINGLIEPHRVILRRHR